MIGALALVPLIVGDVAPSTFRCTERETRGCRSESPNALPLLVLGARTAEPSAAALPSSSTAVPMPCAASPQCPNLKCEPSSAPLPRDIGCCPLVSLSRLSPGPMMANVSIGIQLAPPYYPLTYQPPIALRAALYPIGARWRAPNSASSLAPTLHAGTCSWACIYITSCCQRPIFWWQPRHRPSMVTTVSWNWIDWNLRRR